MSATASFDVENLGPATIAWTETFQLTSKRVDQDFLIEVAWPPVPVTEGRRFAVVYVLDGNHSFGMTAAIARAIQSGPFPLPPTLVVGIGYRFKRPQDQAQWGVLRVRDFTPCTDALFESQYGARTAGGLPVVGGAGAFGDFIETELKPLIASRFPVDADDQTLVGASLGGLFCLHTLLSAPERFQRYVAISPAIYWGDGKLFELEAAQANGREDLAAHVFLASGGLEEGHSAEQKFVSNVYALEARLRARNYPSLDLEMRVFEGETRMSVYPGAVARGLGAVFGGYRDMHDWARWLDGAR